MSSGYFGSKDLISNGHADVCSGVCELTNQSRLGFVRGGALKRQERFRQRGIQCCGIGQYEKKLMCFLSIIACKPI